MAFQRACSTRDSVAEIVADMKAALVTASPRLLVFFASSRHPLGPLGRALEDAFGGVPTIGCSTAGELISGRMLDGSVVALLLDAGHVKDAEVALVTDVNAPRGVRDALESLEGHFKQRVRDMDPARYVGLVLIDGMSIAEERVMATLSEASNVAFVGGSAGDDLAFKETLVYAGGRAVARGVALAILEPATPFAILKTQSFRLLGKRLVVTRADEATRTVHEFDGKPATVAYAEALGVPVGGLADQFLKHPLGLMVHGEPFVRSAHEVHGESVQFFCQVSEGMELSLLEAGDIVADTAAAVRSKVAEMGGISGLINFHCILRTLELDTKKQREAYGQVFADTPMIGFSTYGEAYIGHMNQTSTILLFK